MMLADSKKALVGSINLAPGSFDDRGELAIVADDKHIIGRLNQLERLDWENSRKLDLSDEGLFKDLSNRIEAADQLVLGRGKDFRK